MSTSKEFNRRTFLKGAAGAALLVAAGRTESIAWADAGPINLAPAAMASTSYITNGMQVSAINDGFTPTSSTDTSHGSYGNWPKTDTEWVQYEWSQPVTTNKIDVYWWIPTEGVDAPKAYRVLYWNGSDFVTVANPSGLGVAADRFNSTTFDPVQTTKLRIEIDSDGTNSTGILEWKVYASGAVPVFAPNLDAGVDRTVVMGGKTYLMGKSDWFNPGPQSVLRWSKVSGPGDVRFANSSKASTTASFSQPGEYVLQLAALNAGSQLGASMVNVKAEDGPPKDRLDVVYTKDYTIDSPLWDARAKALIVNWIPHCIDYLERTDLKEGMGGIDNFIEAAKALRGEPHARHKGYVFANAWIHETIEAMCIALMVDPKGDQEIIAAQNHMQQTLGDWIPIVLAAQEPDGYLQTAYTLADRRQWPKRWNPAERGNHEGYTAGYFIEAAINHYTLTNGQDLRLYNAAKKLANCWVAHIGPEPGKQEWYDGHEEMEQALVRFGRFVNDMEGPGHGDDYIKLAKFLLDCRHGGTEYDQSHLPVIQQYEAVGHAVRAAYLYSGMADVAAETHDKDYQSAVMSLWDNMINKKYYVTGGIGSGETSEGFGGNYSLPNNAYCESCSSCGLIFFQYKLNLAYHDAKYADLYEQTMYNALLGSYDLPGTHYCYTNPLINTTRTVWNACPCCVSNISRTLLMVPTWTYVKDKNGIYVNLFIGSKVNVEKVAGTNVQMVQETNYPWDGKIAITVNPQEAKNFTVYVRVPSRTTSALYTPDHPVSGYKSFAVNGQSITPQVVKGYAVVTRTWKAGDKIEMEIPMEIQRLKADPRIKADPGLAALAWGPLNYSFERADQPLNLALGSAPLTTQWRGDLLEGVMVITGQWADGTPMLAVPNFARMNRVEQEPAGANPPADTDDPYAARPRHSEVWIKDAALPQEGPTPRA